MPEPKRQLKVFLCHASQDKPMVRELYQRLKAEGWIDTWLDEKKLLPGQDWRLNIEEAVETSDIVIICLSSNSVSKEGFIQKELRYAREISLEKLEESIFLIPLRIDECDVPRGLRFYQWADYFGEKKNETYNALLESLGLRYEQKLKIEKEEHERKEKEKLEREAAEKVVREKAEREAAERIAKEKAEREVAEKIRLEKAERETAEKVEREKAKREFAEKSKLEKAEYQATRKAELEKSISKSFATLRSTLTSAKPIFRIAGVVGVIIILFWGGSLAIPKLTSLTPAPNSSATISPTKTLAPTVTKTKISTATSRPSTFSLYDDFSTGSASKKFNTALWNDLHYGGNVDWQNGYLVFSGVGDELASRNPAQWSISQIGKLQADLRIDKVNGGYGISKIQILGNLSDGKVWWAQCQAGAYPESTPQIYCMSVMNDTREYLTTAYSIDFGKFYTVAIEIAPDGSYARYYMDGEKIGEYQFNEKALLVNATYEWHIGLWVDSGVTATGAVDNVMIGTLK